jgi:hypothetical protein
LVEKNCRKIIFFKNNFLGLPTPIWKDPNTPPDGQDAVAKQAANIALVVSLNHYL